MLISILSLTFLSIFSSSSSSSLICGLSSLSILLLLPPVRDDFFGKACLAYAHMVTLCLLCHYPGLQLSHLSGSFFVLLFPVALYLPLHLTNFIFRALYLENIENKNLLLFRWKTLLENNVMLKRQRRTLSQEQNSESLKR